jgi:hypothetical protein
MDALSVVADALHRFSEHQGIVRWHFFNAIIACVRIVRAEATTSEFCFSIGQPAEG